MSAHSLSCPLSHLHPYCDKKMDTQTWAKIKTCLWETVQFTIHRFGWHPLLATFHIPQAPYGSPLVSCVCVWGEAPLFPAGSLSLLQLPLHPQVQCVPAARPSASLPWLSWFSTVASYRLIGVFVQCWGMCYGFVKQYLMSLPESSSFSCHYWVCLHPLPLPEECLYSGSTTIALVELGAPS